MKAKSGAHLAQNPFEQLGIPLGLGAPEIVAQVAGVTALL
jgi:hypothetical protein